MSPLPLIERLFGVLVRAASWRVKTYYDNFLSARFFGYQLIGGTGSIAIKLLLPQLGVLDNSDYMHALALQTAGAGGHFLLQFPAYVYFESRHYGQPISSVVREYLAWRTLELIFNPGRYLDAFQANQTSGLFGDSFSAAATSLPISLGQLGSLTTAPLIQGLYRRLQLKKENGIPTDHLEVYRIAVNGLESLAQSAGRTVVRAGAVMAATVTLR